MKWVVIGLGMLVPGTSALSTEVSMEQVINKINPKLTESEVSVFVSSIKKYSNQYGVDSKIIASIIAVESRFNKKAVGSSHGEIGLMQIRPEYHLLKIKDKNTRRKMLFDIDYNISTGVEYLKGLKTVFKPIYNDARWVEHYNVGPNRKPKKYAYTDKILKYYLMFGGSLSEFKNNKPDKNRGIESGRFIAARKTPIADRPKFAKN